VDHGLLQGGTTVAVEDLFWDAERDTADLVLLAEENNTSSPSNRRAPI
jgi:hypothetical protein